MKKFFTKQNLPWALLLLAYLLELGSMFAPGIYGTILCGVGILIALWVVSEWFKKPKQR